MEAVYIVDRPGPARTRLMEGFIRHGFEVVIAQVGDSPLEPMRNRPVGVVVTEVELDGRPMLPLLADMRALQAQAQICVCTAYGSVRTAVAALRSGATHFLIKPVTADQILHALGRWKLGEESIQQPSYHRAVWEYLNQCHEIAGSTAEAARRLGLAPRSLRRMLQRIPPRR